MKPPKHPAVPLVRLLAACVALWLTALAGQAAPAYGERGIVATIHPLATEAALATLQQGGNAVDAVVAAALTLGVVDGHNSGLGGGCFLLLRTSRGELVALDGREQAPARATRDMFVRDGRAVPALSQTGALAVGVPGALAVYDHAVRRFGKLTLAQLLGPAADLAEHGFALDRHYAERLEETTPELRQFPEAAAIFLRPDGRPRDAGERLIQADLARSYRALAREGPGWFYRGPFARATAGWMRTHGGLIRTADFRSYRMKVREPLVTTYRGWQIVGFPPPSSGGVHVAQILNLLEPFDLRSLGPGSPDFIHLAAEAMKRAFADRAHWLGDPDFAPVPRGLLAKEYAATLAAGIRLDRATPVAGHGQPPAATPKVFGRHTTHFAAADAEGNWAACTATLNTSFGAKVVVPGTGILLNNQMDDFSAQPGTTNYFGLVGAEANAVAPRKRPLSSMSPTLVLKDGRPVLATGGAGGPTIITQTVGLLVHVLDFGLDLEAAHGQGRFHHQWLPDELRVERRVSAEVLAELERRGHRCVATDAIGASQTIGVNPVGRGFVGLADPRSAGRAAGW